MTTLMRMARPARPRALAGPLRLPLASALGTPAKVALLRLVTAGGEAISQREAARRAGIQVRSAQRALDDLVALGLVTRLVGGREHLVHLNGAHRLAAALAAVFAQEADHFLALRQALHGVATRARPRPLSLVLFGSAARGDDVLASDVDVLAVGRNPAEAGVLLERLIAAGATLRAAFGAEVRPVTLTRLELRRQWPSRGSLARRAAEDGLLIYGTALYELGRS